MRPTTAIIRTALNTTSFVAPGLAGRAAFGLFRGPLARGAVRPAEQPVMDRARRGELTVAGKRVATYRWGSGDRPVLLVHGWRYRASRWHAFVTALRERGYSPVAFDAPGHGASEGRTTTILEYREIIRALHGEHGPFEAVVAHSFGSLAASFSLRDGVTAGRLVSLGGVAEFGWVLEGFRAGLGLRPRVGQEVRRRVEAMLLPEAGEATRELLTAVVRPGEDGMPVLLVHDEHDDVVPLDQSRRLARAYGERVRLVTTRGLGHRRIITDPGVTAEALGFLSAAEPVR
ncbi:alpha/beta fold hydrolase [Streptomyces sp. DH37]|uniref:alpha/beta fold hydrolase n=1 Tax=Streptomyces sp. DH37 TaxID=3040122 RepID=UPI002441E6BA|nr:alpha/beta hydrolase [Streptomyces sp. DH37]MDG9700996.1 alpha/beta hydrolase [Streptomyces sp. DH37]